MLYSIFKRNVVQSLALFILLNGGVFLAKTDSSAAEPGPMEISGKLISTPVDDILTDAPSDPAAQTNRQKTAPEETAQVTTGSKTG